MHVDDLCRRRAAVWIVTVLFAVPAVPRGRGALLALRRGELVVTVNGTAEAFATVSSAFAAACVS
jgi:hypothetical protein